MQQLNNLANQMIQDRANARVFINNEVVVVGTGTLSLPDVSQQDSNSAVASKSVAGIAAAIFGMVFLAIVL